MLLTDEQILSLLGLAAVTSVESSQLLSALMQNIRYERVLEVDLTVQNERISSWNKARHSVRMGHVAYVDWPTQQEREIAIAAGLGEENKWQVLVSIPDQRTGVPHEINVKVLEQTSSGYRVKKLLDAAPEMLNRLKEVNKARQKIRVFADSRLEPRQLAEIERAASELLLSN